MENSVNIFTKKHVILQKVSNWTKINLLFSQLYFLKNKLFYIKIKNYITKLNGISSGTVS